MVPDWCEQQSGTTFLNISCSHEQEYQSIWLPLGALLIYFLLADRGLSVNNPVQTEILYA